MRDAASELERLSGEVRRLRRSAWAWRAAGLLALAWAVARPVGAVGPQARGGKAVEAERFIVRDSAGKVRAVLGVWDEPLIVEGRGILQVRNGAAGLKVFSPGDPDNPRALLAADEGGSQRLVLDSGGGNSAFLGNTEGGTDLELSGGGINRATLGLDRDGKPGFSLMDSKASSRFQVGIGPDADQTPYMDTFDRKGATFPLLDKAGKPVR